MPVAVSEEVNVLSEHIAKNIGKTITIQNEQGGESALRFNEQLKKLQYHDGSKWVSI